MSATAATTPTPDDVAAFYAWKPSDTKDKMDAMAAWCQAKKMSREETT